MHEIGNGWLAFHIIRKVEYIKLNNTMDINEVCKMLEDKLKEEEKK